jgi:dienelactone hydrolase
MKKIKLFAAVAVVALSLNVSAQEKSKVIENGGSGEYKAIMMEEASLPTHTIFRPADLKPFDKKNPLPILVWGNGACANNPREHINFLNEIASHGFMVVAIGPSFSQGANRSESSQLIDALDWALAQNADKNSPYYKKLDAENVAAAGMSCGGLQTLDVAKDERLKTIMVCNSGLFTNAAGAVPGMPMPEKERLAEIHTPVLYMLGGPTDIAYENGMDDFKRIDHVPVFAANLPVGHGGTYGQPHGGEYAIVALAWLDWQLKGDKKAAKMFKGDKCKLLERKDWTIEKNEMFKKLK